MINKEIISASVSLKDSRRYVAYKKAVDFSDVT